MKSYPAYILGLIFAGLGSMQGADPKPTPVKEGATKEVPLDALAEPGKYELKRRSNSTLTEASRAPFWPIGWVKRVKTSGYVAVDSTAFIKPDPKDFIVTSILLGSPSLAVINGRPYEEGEFLKRLKSNPNKTKIQVKRILDGSVELEAGGHPFIIQQRRDTLKPPAPEALLDSDL